MSDCKYCDMRYIERELPHRYGCPGLEIERLQVELDHALSDAACYRDEGYKLQARNEVLEKVLEAATEHSNPASVNSGIASRQWLLDTIAAAQGEK